MLISDAKADKAAAAMTVGIGHQQDPPQLPGLSHALEHMLFLGTRRYEDEGGYKAFLKAHGGASNAATAGQATTYHFYVHK
jgi:insulysin